MKKTPKLLKYLKSLTTYQIALLLILTLSFLVRFWKLPDLLHWTLDEEFWSYLPFNVAQGYHLPLIGGHIGGTGVYSGPMFVWLMGIIFFLMRSNPLFIAAFVSLVGVIGTGIIAMGFQKTHGKKVSLLASLLYASSTLVTLYDRKYWNASLTTFLGIISLWLVYRLKEQRHYKWVGLLALTASLAIHAHMTGLVLVLFGFISVWQYSKNWRYLLLYSLIVAGTHLPLLVFDLRHDWINTKALISFVSHNEEKAPSPQHDFREVGTLVVNTFSRLLYMPAADIANELTLCVNYKNSRSIPSKTYQTLGLLTVIATLIVFFKKRTPESLLIVVNLTLVIGYFYLSPKNFYPGQLSEYYFLPMFGAFFIVIAQITWKVYKKMPILDLGILAMIVTVNLHTTFNLKHSHSYRTKLSAVEAGLSLVNNRPFSLEVVGDECQIYGYRYLFSWIGKEPVTSYVDNSMSWLYQERLPTQTPEVQLVIDADSAVVSVEKIDLE